MLFLHADYMIDKLTIYDACYKFHLNLRRHTTAKTWQNNPPKRSEKTGHYVCVYTHRHTYMDANDLKDYVQYMGVDK